MIRRLAVVCIAWLALCLWAGSPAWAMSMPEPHRSEMAFDEPAPYYAYDLQDDIGYGASANLHWHEGGCLAIDYAFKMQGKIVEWLTFAPLPSIGVSFKAKTEQPVRLVLRLVDQNGRLLEERRDLPGESDWQDMQWLVWTAKPTSAKARWSPGTLAIGVEHSGSSDYSGTLLIDDLSCMARGNSPANDVEKQHRKWFLANLGLRIVGERPDGYLYFPGERIRLTVSVRRPELPLPLVLTGHIRRGSGTDAVPVKTVTARLNAGNSYTASIGLPVKELGYYEVVWSVSDGRSSSRPMRTSFAVIPKNPQDTQRWDSPFGINVHRWWQGDLLAVARRAGIAWIRDMAMAPYDPATGQCTGEDEVLGKAEANKLCYLPCSEYFDPGDSDVRQDNGRWVFPHAAKKVEAYARMHNSRITHFELYNEPLHFVWGTKFDPVGKRFDGKIGEPGGMWKGPFLDFGIAQTEALHRGDPNMKMIWPEIDVFMDTKIFAEAGAKPYMQVTAPHTYNVHDDKPETQAFALGMPEVRKYFRENGMDTDVWVTEVGLSTYKLKPGDETPKNYLKPQTEQQQAEKLARTIIIDLASGINKTFWYDLYCDGEDPFNSEHNFGIVRFNPLYWSNPWALDIRKNAPRPQYNLSGVWHNTFEPKPGLAAYANVIHWLDGVKSLDRLKSDGWVYSFRRPGAKGVTLVAWTTEKETTLRLRLRSAGGYATVYDLYGEARRVAVKNGVTTLKLTQSPVFVEGLSGTTATTGGK